MVSVGGKTRQAEDIWVIILPLCPTNYMTVSRLQAPFWTSCLFVFNKWVGLDYILRLQILKLFVGLISLKEEGPCLTISMSAFDKCPQWLYGGPLTIPIMGPEEDRCESSLQGCVPEGRGREENGYWRPGNIKGPTATVPTPMTLRHGPSSAQCSEICQHLKVVIEKVNKIQTNNDN